MMTKDVADAEQHALKLAILAEARAEERRGRKLRREGQSEAAIEAYEAARERYSDSGLAYHQLGESALAHEVRRAIERCNTIARNIRYPKPQRPKATLPRPQCLACGKPLRRYKHDGRQLRDGTPREWGDYGDNLFCGLTCGHRWAVAHARKETR